MSSENTQKTRPPIIVVLGHVDHGKTTLLDRIRSTYIDRARSVAEREAGGITQAIGAYEIERKGEKMTFIDTPGHEAFSIMRACGAEVADIAILLVAANDGVKPQTKEAFQCIQDAKIPYVVAINKIDLPEANIEKTKNDLALLGVYLEGQGGNISWQGISAKKGEGVEDLLDLLSLAAQMEDFTYDPASFAEGVVITSGKDSRRGMYAGVVLKNGTLRQGDVFATPSRAGNVKTLENFLGVQARSLEPSAPALMFGWSEVPKVGEVFFAGGDPPAGGDAEVLQARAREVETKLHHREISTKTGEDVLRVVLKADESGSLEALKGIVSKIAESEGNLHIVRADVGQVTETDIKHLLGKRGLLLGFRSKVDKAAMNLARGGHVRVYTSNIIYELEDHLRACLREMFRKPVGALAVLAIFGERHGNEQVVGGRVTLGVVRNQSGFEIQKEGALLGEGKIKNLQLKKKDVSEVLDGSECGMFVESTAPIEAGQELFFF
ncbi:MAG: GTP-binding protein [Nanoarchaeota archaeon]|nr:GTP-binding protein [Nanoarchaeota archaeon]